MRRARRAALAAAVGLAVAGCGPRPIAPSMLPVTTLLARFDAGLAARESRGAALDADVTVWVETAESGRLPGASGRLALAAPDAARLRIGSVFGVALDVGARGDTLAAYVPPRRMGLELDAAAESLTVRRPGALAYRAWSATWRPPQDAWAGAAWRDSLRVLRWAEDGDSLALGVGSSGLPAWAEWRAPGGAPIRLDYLGWVDVGGARWPAQLALEDAARRYRLHVRLQQARASRVADRARVAVRIPAGARRLSLEDLREALERLGDL
jgi:hypothetical protein